MTIGGVAAGSPTCTGAMTAASAAFAGSAPDPSFFIILKKPTPDNRRQALVHLHMESLFHKRL